MASLIQDGLLVVGVTLFADVETFHAPPVNSLDISGTLAVGVTLLADVGLEHVHALSVEGNLLNGCRILSDITLFHMPEFFANGLAASPMPIQGPTLAILGVNATGGGPSPLPISTGTGFMTLLLINSPGTAPMPVGSGEGYLVPIAAGLAASPLPTSSGLAGMQSFTAAAPMPVQGVALGFTGMVGNGFAVSPLPQSSVNLVNPETGNGFAPAPLPRTLGTLWVGANAHSGSSSQAPTPRQGPSQAAPVIVGLQVGAGSPLPVQRSGAGYLHITGVATVRLSPLPLSYGEGGIELPEAWRLAVMNLRNRAVSEYSIAANSVAVAGGKLYMATADGILCLGGDTDRGTAIQSTITTGLLDGGSDNLKRVGNAYLGLSASGPLSLAVVADTATYTYAVPQPSGSRASPTKTQLGRGLRARYWQFSLRANGSRWALDSLAIDDLKTSRRV